ncbi:MAG TPA: Crp/Fnr family transcriptional regulator [Gammaproteobacteria bacterium]|nr:Crp/Fnr family transcriptional regulator [Gammaproteobacteria bacterium]
MDDRETLRQGLKQHYLFAALDDAQLEKVLASTSIDSYPKGERLFRRGDPAHAFYMVLSGKVKLYRLSPDGHEKIMRLLEPWQTFAESIMFMESPRYPVHAEAVEPATVAAFRREAFTQLLQESFDTCRAVMAQMTQRIQAHWDEIEALALLNSRYRVVHYLLGLIPEGQKGPAVITLPTHKTLIAAQLALQPETLSRLFRSLNDEGLIEYEGDSVVVPNIDQLRGRIY